MDLRSHHPFWLLKNGILRDYPSIDRNLSTEVCIIGAGITGALVAWHLSKRGVPVIILDRRHVGMGSTVASTSLLQYEIDTPLYKLQHLMGNKKAERCYLLCRQSIYDLGKVSSQLAMGTSFNIKPSFQFASYPSHVPRLQKEYKARKAIGIELEYLDEKEIKKHFNFSRPGGLLSKDGGELDAYRMTHALLQQVEAGGNIVFDHSEVTGIRYFKRGVELRVNGKFKVSSKKLVIACGYESQKYINKKIEELVSTFAIISEPFSKQDFWLNNALIWETTIPYLYMKVTDDWRILVRGKDVPFYNPVKRDKVLPSKAGQLGKAFHKLFPQIDFKTDFQWAGTFSSTKDGLPYIGSIPQRPHTFFALGFGGNGITFSEIAAQLICDQLTGARHPDIDLFSFDR